MYYYYYQNIPKNSGVDEVHMIENYGSLKGK